MWVCNARRPIIIDNFVFLKIQSDETNLADNRCFPFIHVYWCCSDYPFMDRARCEG
jgi:hypothetical protein